MRVQQWISCWWNMEHLGMFLPTCTVCFSEYRIYSGNSIFFLRKKWKCMTNHMIFLFLSCYTIVFLYSLVHSFILWAAIKTDTLLHIMDLNHFKHVSNIFNLYLFICAYTFESAFVPVYIYKGSTVPCGKSKEQFFFVALFFSQVQRGDRHVSTIK